MDFNEKMFDDITIMIRWFGDAVDLDSFRYNMSIGKIVRNVDFWVKMILNLTD
jgi:hypothetical protein